MMTRTFLIACSLFWALLSAAQQKQSVNLLQLQQSGRLQAVNRQWMPADTAHRGGVAFTEQEGQGLAWIQGHSFTTGTIEVDLKGKDVLQRSFIGIAFQGVNDSTYEAVYFRPFNFRSTDSVRRIHAVQYISHPQYTWERLRTERNAEFEKAVNPVPDPNGWFHARIQVRPSEVLVYVNESTTPSLRVPRLNPGKGQRIGLWTGSGSGGTFRNLTIAAE
ncbi:MAG TPA: hypothetical protein VHK69_04215 [Chitinophagaceae bacterium]|jgi:hypothetical protein|nr:hypothetical protein [Chitinophagaceae bacterium]